MVKRNSTLRSEKSWRRGLIKVFIFNKLAAFSICIYRATNELPVAGYGLGISKLNKIKAIDKFIGKFTHSKFRLLMNFSFDLRNQSYTICDIQR